MSETALFGNRVAGMGTLAATGRTLNLQLHTFPRKIEGVGFAARCLPYSATILPVTVNASDRGRDLNLLYIMKLDGLGMIPLDIDPKLIEGVCKQIDLEKLVIKLEPDGRMNTIVSDGAFFQNLFDALAGKKRDKKEKGAPSRVPIEEALRPLQRLRATA